jgi:hypothetical protein
MQGAFDSEQISILNKIQLRELQGHIDTLSRGYMSNEDREEYEKWLHDPKTIIGIGGGRHNHTLFIVSSYFWKWGGEWLGLAHCTLQIS